MYETELEPKMLSVEPCWLWIYVNCEEPLTNHWKQEHQGHEVEEPTEVFGM